MNPVSNPILEVENLGRRFGAFTALEGVSAAFGEGRITAIIGPNGAGKSTFFNLLSGALKPTSGSLRFSGRDMSRVPQARFAHLGIARSYQITNLFPRLTAHENVRTAIQARTHRYDFWSRRDALTGLGTRADEILDAVGLSGRRDRPAASLAHGEQRALEIGISLAADPKLLLLDEPTAGMGPEETKEMVALLRRLGESRTILLVEHKMKMILGLSERILVLHHGRLIADGTPSEIQADREVRRVYLGQSGGTAMLEIDRLDAWYGPSHVLHGLSLEVRPGEILALVGRNGAGKTTTMKAVMGLIPKVAGSVRFLGEDLLGRPAHARFPLGLAYVPEDRRIVPGLTVRENLKLGLLRAPASIKEGPAIAEIAETFPRLAERLDQTAVTMSGGEQQMLAIARAMIARPKLILLDEPSEGIMPVLVEEMGRLFVALRERGVTLLLVEQNVEWALNLADRAVIIDQGAVVHESSAAALRADTAIQDRYCAV